MGQQRFIRVLRRPGFALVGAAIFALATLVLIYGGVRTSPRRTTRSRSAINDLAMWLFWAAFRRYRLDFIAKLAERG
jgi:multisubunit Na+/H+ antiporter MnhB subunit